MPDSGGKLVWLSKVEWALAISLSAAVLILLGVRAAHAGALWRDECGTVQLAQMPTIWQIIDSFDHQTFPPLVPLLVRVYTHLFGGGDGALRWFGFAAGVAFVSVAWLNARVSCNGVPLLSLALCGLSPTFLTWGTTLSGYGFGAVLIVSVFAASTKMLRSPTPGVVLGGFTAALISQQFVIGNLILAVIIALSALFVASIRRAFKAVVIFAALALCCLLIGVLYLKIFSTGDWRIVLHERCHFSDLWREFSRAYGTNELLTWLSRICFATSVTSGLWTVWRNFNKVAGSELTVLLFAVLVTLLSSSAYFASLLLLGYRTHPWHYLLLLALLAASIDIVLLASRIRWLLIARVTFAIVAAAAVVTPAWKAARQRKTDMDIVAATATKLAKPNDLIVVAPWPFGISFNRYYHGPTPWITLPIIEDHQIHRYDLMLAKMISSQPIDDVFQRIHQTLASGNRVWFVGGISAPAVGDEPLSVMPAPDARFGWNCAAYMESWTQEMAVFVLVHTQRAEVIAVAADEMVNAFENVPLAVADGWK
jgi:hypothetical protein